jgi:hypothetical protein
MTPLWNRLNSYADDIASKFDTYFLNFDNPKYTEDMHFDGWSDRFWCSSYVSKCHLKIIQPADMKSLWLMHINIFPKVGYEFPILGFDIVAGPKKITGSFMDYSPITEGGINSNLNHPYHGHMHNQVHNLEWNKPRELPPWAKEIFSKDMIAVGNLKDGEELEQFIEVTTELVDFYLSNLKYNSKFSGRDTKPILNKYCQNQKLNPHLHRSILAMGISEEDKDRYVNDVLFEEI